MMLTWQDKSGVNHSMPFESGMNLIRRFYEEWPGGFPEIEAALKARPVAYVEHADLNAGKVRGQFKELFRHMDLTEVPGPSGRQVFKDLSTESAWRGWRMLAALKAIEDATTTPEPKTPCPKCGAPCNTKVNMRGGEHGWGTTEAERTVYSYSPMRKYDRG